MRLRGGSGGPFGGLGVGDSSYSDEGGMLIAATDLTPRWYLLHTRPKQEAKVLSALAARGLEGYCPRVLEPRVHTWEPKGPTPTFPGYVFARFVLAERHAAAQYCTGAAGLVRLGDHFAALDDPAIDAFRLAEGCLGYVALPSARRILKEGSRVTVTRGPLAGLEGTVTRYLPAKARVQLLMKAVWAGRRVELDARHVA
jgi:transcriptional antiterminator RfaH